MTDTKKDPGAHNRWPRAQLRQRRWNFSVVWVVPIVAAIVAGYLVYDRVQELGPTITIKFKDGGGLKVGQTAVQYRGVRIGEVRAIELSEDLQDVLVEVRLHRSANSIAQEGSVFWIVRLGGGIENLTGLGTVISGPHIEALPGNGEHKSEFVGLESAPVALEGLKLVLVAERLESLKVNAPVYYRGVEVGAVQAYQLSGNATTVNVHVFIKKGYEKLVRAGSQFWTVSGVEVRLGLLRGLEVNVQSLRSLVGGGIAFATPDTKTKPAADGTVFPLHKEPKREWLQWAPAIQLAMEQ